MKQSAKSWKNIEGFKSIAHTMLKQASVESQVAVIRMTRNGGAPSSCAGTIQGTWTP